MIVGNYDISLIIPVYNAGKYLKATLESVISQTIFEIIEVILVNDGSDDDSLSICKVYSEKYFNIKVIDQDNAGVSAARNVGIKNSTGKFVTFLDSDDLIEKDLYEEMLKLIKFHSADIAVVDFDKIHRDGKMKKYRNNFFKEWLSCEDGIKDFFAGVIGNQVVDKIFARKIIEEIRFPEGYKIGEDMYFIYQALKLSNKVVMDTRICGYHYVVREDSAMTGKFSDKYFHPVKLSNKMYLDYSENPYIASYAKAHLVHETCKALEYTYRHNAALENKKYVAKLRYTVHEYKISDAKKYLIKKQFYGFILMRMSPKIYLAIHKIMRIG